jgi:hypothetical protein
MKIDRKELYAHLDKTAAPKGEADAEDPGAEDETAEDELQPYRMMLKAIKANDPAALKAAYDACREEANE